MEIENIFRAVASGDAAEAALALANGADMETRFFYEMHTPLILAAGLGHIEIVELLLQRGAKMEARNKKGQTALLAATGGLSLHMTPAVAALKEFELVFRNGFNAVDPLLDNGAHTNARDHSGNSALIHCVKHPDIAHPAIDDRIKKLLRHGAKVNVTDIGQTSALHYVAQFRTPAIIDEFFNHKADFEIRDAAGRTPLLAAAQANRRDNVNHFIICGASTDVYDNAGDNLFSKMDVSAHEWMELMLARRDRHRNMKRKAPPALKPAIP